MNIETSLKLLFSDNDIWSHKVRSMTSRQLKRVYRDLAFSNHPDRSVHIGISRAVLTERFKSITEAYLIINKMLCDGKTVGELLPKKPEKATKMKTKTGFWHKKDKKSKKKKEESTPIKKKSPQGERPIDEEGKKPTRSSPFRKSVNRSHYFPNTELMFGQFLYYSGLITLQDLIQALSWQRIQRPPVGELARDWGILSIQDIIIILKNKKGPEKFAETATRLGFFSTVQHQAVLYRQRCLQKPIGDYFVDHGLITPNERNGYLRKMKEHNLRIKYR
jgi:hypothetical protein